MSVNKHVAGHKANKGPESQGKTRAKASPIEGVSLLTFSGGGNTSRSLVARVKVELCDYFAKEHGAMGRFLATGSHYAPTVPDVATINANNDLTGPQKTAIVQVNGTLPWSPP